MSPMDSQTGNSRHFPRNIEFAAFLSDAESTAIVERFALDQRMLHTLIRQGTVDDAIAALGHLERPPQRLVMDISASALPLSDLARLSEACLPGISVVVIGDRNDVGLFRELLRMGVDEYLSKPLTIDLLRRILGCAEPSQSQAGNPPDQDILPCC